METALGYKCIVVDGISEFTLKKDVIVSKEESMAAEIDSEAMERVRDKISGIHSSLERILYNTRLAINDEASAQRLAEISNIVLALEKETLNLGSAITKEENNHMEPMPLPKEEPRRG